MTTLERPIAAAVAILMTAIALAVCYRKVRKGERQGLWVALGCYCLLLLPAFLFAVMVYDEFGWSYLPLMIITAPWSFFLAAPLAGILHKWGLEWIGSLLMDFLVLVVVCGGLNMLLLYFFIKRIAYPPGRSSII